MLRGYIENLKARTAEANRLCERQSAATRRQLRSDFSCVKPLTEQVDELMCSLPPALRDRPWTMVELISRLDGRYKDRPSAGDVGQALRALGWVQRRDWTHNGGGRRYWYSANH
jgi:hypothetical protein